MKKAPNILLFIFLQIVLVKVISSQNQTMTDIDKMLQNNPLLAKMSMFQNHTDNGIEGEGMEDEEIDEESEEEVEEPSLRRSPGREIVQDNFDHRYKALNESLFDTADSEFYDIGYREFENDSSIATGRALSDDEEDLEVAIENEKILEQSTTMKPFIASESLFETTVAQNFARSSPYFNSFSTLTTTTTMEPPTTQSALSNDINSNGENDEVQQFFINNKGKGSEEEEEENEEDGNDLEDISSMKNEKIEPTMGLPKATYHGISYMKMNPLGTTEMPRFPNVPSVVSIPKFKRRKDEHEVVQFNGKYSVSATKYYVDNRIDGDHYSSKHNFDEQPTQISVDPFAVENEVRKVAKMHAAKTIMIDPLELEMEEENTMDEPETTVKYETKNGKEVETRETNYRGKKTTIELWNKLLHGHDLLKYPGAIFDDKFDEKRRKSGRNRAFGSKILLSNSKMRSRLHQTIITGVTDGDSEDVVLNEMTSNTEDIESACFISKQNATVQNLSPFKTYENVTKLDCLFICAKSLECLSASYSESLECEVFSEEPKPVTVINSQNHSLHRKIPNISLRCIELFISDENTENLEPFTISEDSPDTLRLVENSADTHPNTATAAVSLFPSTPHCPQGQDSIFVRSDDVEGSHTTLSELLDISEDDCVFACLTDTRPGGGEPLDCVAAEYDKRRGLCNLIKDFPEDVTMTPTPLNPVNLYEKICVQQATSDKCSGGQPIRFRQKVLVGHLIDAHSVGSATECIDLCVSKHSIGCVSITFYSTETTLNCILNDKTHEDDPNSFYTETTPSKVDYFSIEDCLGIREIERRARKRLKTIRTEEIKKRKRSRKLLIL